MQHFPIYISTRDQRIVVSGAGTVAVAKLRLLLKTEASVEVFAVNPVSQIVTWADAGRITLIKRRLEAGDVIGAKLFYAADADPIEDARTAALANAEGALVNIVDNLRDSDFITPAIIDRDPVTIAIGTEGAAPVLARLIKADMEQRLAPTLGILARIGKAFRPMVEQLPAGRQRRGFWADFYQSHGPKALASGGVSGVSEALHSLLGKYQDDTAQATKYEGHVDFVGAGPGDPELLTLKARNALDRADVIIHDRLVPAEILELVRREAEIIEAGKTGFGPSTPQQDINQLIVEHARRGAHVVRLKSGDPTVFGRLDEELDAVSEAGIAWQIMPGITAASAAVASLGQSLTKRNRNSSVRFLTGHDMAGFADHDWAELAKPGSVAAIYMGKRAARYVQGRLMMFGASANTPVTAIENASQPSQHIHPTTLAHLPETLAGVSGPAVIFLGLEPRAAIAAATDIEQKELVL